jgi:YegS/Rv2252/BmrU family lipid kinase
VDVPGAPETRIRVSRGDRLLVVANPAIRRNISRVVDSLKQAAPAGVDIDVRITTRAGEAAELAHQHAPGAKMVIAIGGDGTVAEVAAAVIEHGIPLGILAGGSTNIIAREMRVPTDTDAGAALILGPHRVRSIDVGHSDRRVFLHMAGAGFDSRLFARSNSRLKRRIGWLAYLPSAARALTDKPSMVKVVVDDRTFEAKSPMVLVANGKSVVHPLMKLASGISKADGKLDVFIVTATGPVALARVLGKAALQRMDESPYVTRMSGKHIEIVADPPLPVQFDGDVDGVTPVILDIEAAALKVVVPELPEERRRGHERSAKRNVLGRHCIHVIPTARRAEEPFTR